MSGHGYGVSKKIQFDHLKPMIMELHNNFTFIDDKRSFRVFCERMKHCITAWGLK